jgi:alpha-galactosidase
MKIRIATMVLAACWISLPSSAVAVVPTPGEMGEARRWTAAKFEGVPQPSLPETNGRPTDAGPFFSFTYANRPSTEMLATWKLERASRKLGERRTERTFTYTDSKTGLVLRCVGIEYGDFPAVEWTLYFRNTGHQATPMLENVLPLDMSLSASNRPSPPVLHYAKGALCSIDDYAPVDMALKPGTRVHLQPGGGRSSSEVLPFFNVDAGETGMILGIGWTGQWAATFSRDADGPVRVQSGMALTHLKLRPGEEIRTPRMLALFWRGQSERGNNLLRRFLLTHHRPHPNGKPLVLPVLAGGWGGTAAAEHLKTIRRIVQPNLPIELYWIDAGWFGGEPWWKNNGNWPVRHELYPQGFRVLSDSLHQAARRLLLWFELQRVCRGTAWAKFQDRPGWLLELGPGTPEYKQHNMDWKIPHGDPRWVLWESRRSQIAEDDLLWNMGEPSARRFLTDWLSARIDEFGVDWYREDFNIAPLEFWRHADAADRQGITEIRYIEGLYAMWDELFARHPGLAIDNCASGGRRIDLETVGRATALWRTDWPADAIHKQCHSFGLFRWVPLHMTLGGVLKKGNEYEIRSGMTAGMSVELPPEDNADSARQAQTLIEQYRGIQKFYYGDYYPLTPYSQRAADWMAWQFDLPERGEGMVQAFRRPQAPSESTCAKLHGLEPGTVYTLKNLDVPGATEMTGRQLMDVGLSVVIKNRPGAVIVTYEKKS